ncbi:hypothetical protein ZWY2020_034999 [Hordeum vulgare]|nr:hypothetical protein ZWY2020_034999 [Hordeum vulgare]
MDCGLTDLGYSGPRFTWCNKQDSCSHVKCRVDRVMANGAFSSCFKDCTMENLIATTSVHYPILISLEGSANQMRTPPVQQGFRFEEMWLRGEDYKDTLERVWSNGRSAILLCNLPGLMRNMWLVHCVLGGERLLGACGDILGSWNVIWLLSAPRLPLPLC